MLITHYSQPMDYRSPLKIELYSMKNSLGKPIEDTVWRRTKQYSAVGKTLQRLSLSIFPTVSTVHCARQQQTLPVPIFYQRTKNHVLYLLTDMLIQDDFIF